jgi:catechol 2,3-dioxygenase-like lactoylglutathione lyase family enzyme
VATIDHVAIRCSDLAASLALYAHSFELLEFRGDHVDSGGFHEWDDFAIATVEDDRPRTANLHVGFAAVSPAQVDGWWRALTGAGHPDDGAPGPRQQYGPGYYGAFVRDPDGNSIEAVVHERTTRVTGVIDHVWVRVRDLEATTRFYEAVAPVVGVEVLERPGRLMLTTESGTVSFVVGLPTENLHLAFGVGDVETVAAFHAAGLSGGGLDNGAPGERPEYHPGYYGAFLRDPDGNNIEAVFHDR